MNSTPNYHFEKTAHICGIGEIDRELRRVEDKVDCVAQSLRCGHGKPNCGGDHGKPSCNCNCEEELGEIRDELADRYTKAEADQRTDEKIEEHSQAPYAHQDLREALAKKVEERDPDWTVVELQHGIQDETHPAVYRKELNVVYIQGFPRKLEVGKPIFTLPTDCRPSHIIHFITPQSVRAGATASARLVVNPTGEVVIEYAEKPEVLVHGLSLNMSFTASAPFTIE